MYHGWHSTRTFLGGLYNTITVTVLLLRYPPRVCVAHTRIFHYFLASVGAGPDFASPIPIVTQYIKTNINLYLVPINFAIKVRGARYSTSTSKSQTDILCIHNMAYGSEYGLRWFKIYANKLEK